MIEYTFNFMPMYNFHVYGVLREYTTNQTSYINLLFLGVLLTIL